MTPHERHTLAAAVAVRERHFPSKARGGSRHLNTCSRGNWQGKRERWVDTGDGAGWGAPCTPHCLADHAAFDALDALLAAHPEPVQIRLLGEAS